jgi:hypothetical protein
VFIRAYPWLKFFAPFVLLCGKSVSSIWRGSRFNFRFQHFSFQQFNFSRPRGLPASALRLLISVFSVSAFQLLFPMSHFHPPSAPAVPSSRKADTARPVE